MQSVLQFRVHRYVQNLINISFCEMTYLFNVFSSADTKLIESRQLRGQNLRVPIRRGQYGTIYSQQFGRELHWARNRANAKLSSRAHCQHLFARQTSPTEIEEHIEVDANFRIHRPPRELTTHDEGIYRLPFVSTKKPARRSQRAFVFAIITFALATPNG